MKFAAVVFDGKAMYAFYNCEVDDLQDAGTALGCEYQLNLGEEE